MADVPRRLRTQAERDTDDHTWPLRHAIGVRTADGQIHDPRDIVLIYPSDPDIWMTTEPIAPPRRRWWHRSTRRNP